jgi:cullin-associated NEDD8-dissociated protein 1
MQVLKSNRDVFVAKIGGFDTHSDATATLATLLGDINDALASFVAEMQLQGVWDDVTVIASSEFGRTLVSNGLGTDHAWGGNCFVAGGSVRGGGVFGEYPKDIRANNHLDVGRGRLIPTTPWEAIWTPIAGWFGVEDTDAIFPNGKNFDNIMTEPQMYQ